MWQQEASSRATDETRAKETGTRSEQTIVLQKDVDLNLLEKKGSLNYFENVTPRFMS